MNAEEMHAIAKAASDFWVSQVSEIPGSNNGAKDIHALTASMLRQLAVIPVDEAALIHFGLCVYDVVLTALVSGEDYLSFGVDYHPDGLLREALEDVPEAKAIASQLPWKTRMSFWKGILSVSCGYGAKAQQIYPPVESPATSDKGSSSC